MVKYGEKLKKYLSSRGREDIIYAYIDYDLLKGFLEKWVNFPSGQMDMQTLTVNDLLEAYGDVRVVGALPAITTGHKVSDFQSIFMDEVSKASQFIETQHFNSLTVLRLFMTKLADMKNVNYESLGKSLRSECENIQKLGEFIDRNRETCRKAIKKYEKLQSKYASGMSSWFNAFLQSQPLFCRNVDSHIDIVALVWDLYREQCPPPPMAPAESRIHTKFWLADLRSVFKEHAVSTTEAKMVVLRTIPLREHSKDVKGGREQSDITIARNEILSKMSSRTLHNYHTKNRRWSTIYYDSPDKKLFTSIAKGEGMDSLFRIKWEGPNHGSDSKVMLVEFTSVREFPPDLEALNEDPSTHSRVKMTQKFVKILNSCELDIEAWANEDMAGSSSEKKEVAMKVVEKIQTLIQTYQLRPKFRSVFTLTSFFSTGICVQVQQDIKFFKIDNSKSWCGDDTERFRLEDLRSLAWDVLDIYSMYDTQWFLDDLHSSTPPYLCNEANKFTLANLLFDRESINIVEPELRSKIESLLKKKQQESDDEDGDADSTAPAKYEDDWLSSRPPLSKRSDNYHMKRKVTSSGISSLREPLLSEDPRLPPVTVPRTSSLKTAPSISSLIGHRQNSAVDSISLGSDHSIDRMSAAVKVGYMYIFIYKNIYIFIYTNI
eukprot:GHVL01023690.1.p1 GENE.GHVL01023690.1~~GHVL01023690.1.p1  ORF type:complete len:660 (+),score=109.90 GHVL01023690.1:42-2021(+)